MERGRGTDGEQGAETQRHVGKCDQGPDFGAVSCVDTEVSSSFASADASPRAFDSSDRARRRYVQSVLDAYRSLPGTAKVTSRHDRRCAQALFRRRIPLHMVQSAMVVAAVRRTFRRGDPLPRIRALHFFLPVIEELLEVPCDPGYVQYLKNKLEAYAGREIRLHRDEAAQPEATCRNGKGSPPPLREAPSSRGR